MPSVAAAMLDVGTGGIECKLPLHFTDQPIGATDVGPIPANQELLCGVFVPQLAMQATCQASFAMLAILSTTPSDGEQGQQRVVRLGRASVLLSLWPPSRASRAARSTDLIWKP